MTDQIHSHVFPNGLVLVAEPMRALESAAFTFLSPAGCAFDPADRCGLAALTCEMSLRGAGDHDSRGVIQALENLGVEHGESVTTSHATYSGATLARNLLPALEIYADIVRRPRFAEDQFEPVRAVILQELRAIEDEPSQKLMQELRRRFYPDPWGRSSHGSQASVESIELGDVRKFYERRYRPNGAILGVAGRIDWPQLKDEVERLFGDWPATELAAPSESAPQARHEHVEHDGNQTHIGLAYASVPYRDPDYFQAWGAVGVLSGGMSSRLFTEVREKRGLCYTVYATCHTLHDRGSVLCYSGTSAERAQETLDVMAHELTRLAEGIETAELDRLKARIKSGLIMQQESSFSRSGSIARDWYHLGRARTLAEVGKLVDGLSQASINAYLRKNPPRDFTIVTLGPQPLESPRGIS